MRALRAKAFVLSVLICLSAGCRLEARDKFADDPASFMIHFAPKTDMAGMQIKYFITGPFGSYHSYRAFIGTAQDVYDYEIPLAQEKGEAETLKFIVYGPKYHTKVFNFPTLARVEKSVDVELAPIDVVGFYGQVVFPEKFVKGKFRVKVDHLPLWECAFFAIKDCMQGTNEIAVTDLKDDGSFQIDLPDFASDPEVAALKTPGKFYFAIEGEQNGEFGYYRLTPAEKPAALAVPEAKSYARQKFIIVKN